MANNRMSIKCNICGKSIVIAKLWQSYWEPWDSVNKEDFEQFFVDHFHPDTMDWNKHGDTMDYFTIEYEHKG